MPASDQGSDARRYRLVPRTAIFVRDGDAYLLIKGAPTKRLWPNKYNGVGGHVDRGEDVLSAATRELREETGLEARLWLCGTIIVDAGEVGVGLYVLTGEVTGGNLRASSEGIPEWIPVHEIARIPAVEDVEALVRRVHRMRRGDAPFSGRSFYDAEGKLHVVLSP